MRNEETMHRFWKSTEFWFTLGLVGLFMFGLIKFSGINVIQHSIMLSILLNSYIISRCIFKQNRGLFYTGLQTSELYFTLIQHIWFLGLLYFKRLDIFHVLVFILIAQVIYNICRGLTKAIGSKNSVLIR